MVGGLGVLVPDMDPLCDRHCNVVWPVCLKIKVILYRKSYSIVTVTASRRSFRIHVRKDSCEAVHSDERSSE